MITRNQFVALLSSATLIASLSLPIGAYAASDVRVVGVQAVNISTTNTDYKDLGEIKIDVPVSDLNNDDSFLLRLPTDFKINIPAAISSTTDLAGATITKPDGTVEPLIQLVNGSDPWNDGIANHLSIFQTGVNELKFVVKNAAKAPDARSNMDSANSVDSVNTTNTGLDSNTVFKINLGSVYVPASADDTINAVIEARPGIAFSNETVTLATKGTGTVTVSIDSTKTMSENGAGTLDTIRFKEDSPGSLSAGDNSLKLTLPAGFEWADSSYVINLQYGDSTAVQTITATRQANTNELVLHVPTATKAASYFTIQNAAIRVNDSSIAQYGNIALTVSGSSKTNTSSLIVGNYVRFGTTVNTEKATTIIAGRAGATDAENTKTGQLIIQENAPGSLREGGTIRLQLTGGVKWAVDTQGQLVQPPQIDTSLSDMQGLELDQSIGNHGWDLAGTSGDTIEAKVKTASNGIRGSKLVLDNGLVDIAADAPTGEVHAILSGNAGVTGDAGVFANVVPPATIQITDSTPNHIQAGVQDRTLSDVYVKENVPGAIGSTDGSTPYVRLTFQQGVIPNRPDPSQITVDGDLVLNTTDITTDRDETGHWYIQIPVQAKSTKASTIRLAGEKVTVDRTVPEGNLMVDLGGSMVQTTAQFPQAKTIASTVAGTIVVPVNGSVMNSATFLVGSTAYTVNELNKTMDVAPFIDENGRTQLPVRAVSEALGAIVGWDPQDQTVTILKDGKAISITVGSYVMNVQGVFVQNDSPGIIKNGRVFLPLRIIAEALGAKVDWDAKTQTVYLN